jgi:hypothetical protein
MEDIREMEHSQITHPFFGVLRRRLHSMISFPWEMQIRPVVDWNLHMKSRVNPDENLIIVSNPDDKLARLEVWTNDQGAIQPEQVDAAKSLQVNISHLLRQLTEELMSKTKAFIEGELEDYPELAPKLHSFRITYPFPTGEFRHSATEITNVFWREVPFVVLWFSCSWLNEHSAKVLIHNKQVVDTSFHSWDPQAMVAAIQKM